MVAWLRSLPRPLALFCVTDVAGSEMLTNCDLAGLRVPEEISVLGVDNRASWCEPCHPPLSSVAIPWRRVGYGAAHWVARLLAGEKPPEEMTLVAPEEVVTRQSSEMRAIPDPTLADAMAFIRGNACDRITVATVAAHAGIDRRRLERAFRKHLGRSPHDELARIRMDPAKLLLAKTGLNVEDIAERIGLSSNRFWCLFRTAVGTTPAACFGAHRHEAKP